MAFTLDEYVRWTQQQSYQQQQPHHAVQAFEIPQGNSKVLEVNLGIPSSTGEMLSQVWTKMESMVAYKGDISFKREGVLDHGFANMLKKAVTDEGTVLTKATAKGRAQLYLADNGKEITIFRLQGDSIVVNGNDVLALEPSVKQEITMMKKVSSMASGGMFNIKLSGVGMVAVLTHGKPITLTVGPGLPPVFTDPDATVAWSGTLSPDFKTDVQWKTLVGRGSGESFQMKFDSSKNGKSGFVLVQPFEEHVSS